MSVNINEIYTLKCLNENCISYHKVVAIIDSNNDIITECNDCTSTLSICLTRNHIEK